MFGSKDLKRKGVTYIAPIRRMLMNQMGTEEKLSECHHEEQIAN